MKKYSFLLIVFLFFIFTGVWLFNLFAPSVSKQSGMVFYLKPGTSKSALIADLSKRGVIRFPFLFSVYAHIKAKTYLKTGEYYFPPRSSAISVWRQVTNGIGFFQRPFTIVPGWTFKQLRDALLQAEGLEHQLASFNDKQAIRRLGYPKRHPEGIFFPDTYYYTRGLSDFTILQRAIHDMQKRLADAWQQRTTGLPYQDAYQALIVASLIEKETHLDRERPIIAGVIVNRLKKNMLLQIDPTVIYGMGERYQGVLNKNDLLQDTPYNTYIHKGLPPTPIAIPSMASIDAALHPAQHRYYYFVAWGREGHQFSETLSAHQAASAVAIKRRHGYFNEVLVRTMISRLIKFQ
ncbi:MAG: hypothetical protein A3F42_00305 [Gammaproteobacteria bacterium RIFCSPHIGHO2_12_FULL_37_34]|nr:MAG: hypothetical protein A3F42_00305 [Gammaproteobacteria bacterium RIFCSPHIGHO2_12_FULL_37_34]